MPKIRVPAVWRGTELAMALGSVAMLIGRRCFMEEHATCSENKQDLQSEGS
jgi:hypothetical protein